MRGGDFTGSQSKVIVVVMTILGLLAALLIGRALGEQNYMPVLLVVGGIFGALFFFTLGEKYWYVIPLALVTGLPALPILGRTLELGELSIAACSVIFVTRIALKKDTLILFRPTHLPVLLFMGWVLFIFILNPIGFLIFGAQTAGARFYLKLLLSFSAFLILASSKITEKDARNIVWILILGGLVGMGYGILRETLFGGGESVVTSNMDSLEVDNYYTWQQVLSVPAMTISFLIFSRLKPSQVFGLQKPWALLLYLGTIVLALLSGKRMGFAAITVAPIVSALVFRQRAYIWVALIGFLAMASIVVIGQGKIFTLPLIAQRTLSWMPADWDSSLRSVQGGSDEFRETLRRFALENIRHDPIIGKGFAIDLAETGSAINAAQYGGGSDIQLAAYALGRAWHNTWFGYAADFGIPMSIIQAALLLTVLVVSFQTARRLKHPSYLQTLAIYLLIFTTRDILASHTSGHTALDAFERWWMYGMLFSIAAAASPQDETVQKPEKSRLTLPKPVIGHAG